MARTPRHHATHAASRAPRRLTPFSLSGGSALITGAGMGMGRLHALRAAEEGAASVELWDVDAEALASVTAEVEAAGSRAIARVVDVSDQQALTEAAAETVARGPLALLINNAGIVRGAPFHEHTSSDINATMAINTLAPMHLTRALLPSMIDDDSRPRRILNVASAAGTLANPRMSVYAASKWAMIGWSDSVRIELQQLGLRHLAVSTFCPSYISTGMFEGARGPLLTPLMTPERAVQLAWTATIKGTPMTYAPGTVHLAKAARGLLPTAAWDLAAAKVFKVYSSMEEFTGRQAPKPGPTDEQAGRTR